MARESILQFEEIFVLGKTVNTGYTDEIAEVGRTISVDIEPVFQANDTKANAGITLNDVVENKVDITITQYFDVSFPLPNFDVSMVKNQDKLVKYLRPAVLAMAQKIESWASEDFTYNITDNDLILGDPDNIMALNLLIDANNQLFMNKIPVQDFENMHAIFGGYSRGALLKEDKNLNNDFTGENGQVLKFARMGARAGFNMWGSQFTRGPKPEDTSGAVNNVGGYAADEDEIVTDGFTAAPPVGALFTFAGHATKYTVVEATKDGNDTTIKFAPALTDAVDDDEAITVLDVEQSLAFHKSAYAFVMPPLSRPKSNVLSEVVTHPMSGYSMRLTIDWNQQKQRDEVVLAAVCGGKLIRPAAATRLLAKKATEAA
jgi:hypothetical protein